MNCQYCQRELKEINRKGYTTGALGKGGKVTDECFIDYVCDACQVSYEYMGASWVVKDLQLIATILRGIEVKGTEFEVRYDYVRQETRIYCFKLHSSAPPTLSPTMSLRRQNVQDFPFLTGWTPSNVKEKLNTYMVFL